MYVPPSSQSPRAMKVVEEGQKEKKNKEKKKEKREKAIFVSFLQILFESIKFKIVTHFLKFFEN